MKVEKTGGATIKGIVEGAVEKGGKIYTDEWKSYNVLNHDYEKSIFGIYHHVSEKHLDAYVNEFGYRYNTRDLSDGSRFDLTLANGQKDLHIKNLSEKKIKELRTKNPDLPDLDLKIDSFDKELSKSITKDVEATTGNL